MVLSMFSEDFTSVFAEDSMVLYFGWGLLLAELAACHAYWRVRLQEWSLGLAKRWWRNVENQTFFQTKISKVDTTLVFCREFRHLSCVLRQFNLHATS